MRSGLAINLSELGVTNALPTGVDLLAMGFTPYTPSAQELANGIPGTSN
jgi:hypothetical protein